MSGLLLLGLLLVAMMALASIIVGVEPLDAHDTIEEQEDLK